VFDVCTPPLTTTKTMTTTPTTISQDRSRYTSNRMRDTCYFQCLRPFPAMLPFLWMVVITIFSTLPVGHAKNLHLTFGNYNELTQSKTVFLKFYAPWSVRKRSQLTVKKTTESTPSQTQFLTCVLIFSCFLGGSAGAPFAKKWPQTGTN
jgi:hypothetical protein